MVTNAAPLVREVRIVRYTRGTIDSLRASAWHLRVLPREAAGAGTPAVPVRP